MSRRMRCYRLQHRTPKTLVSVSWGSNVNMHFCSIQRDCLCERLVSILKWLIVKCPTESSVRISRLVEDLALRACWTQCRGLMSRALLWNIVGPGCRLCADDRCRSSILHLSVHCTCHRSQLAIVFCENLPYVWHAQNIQLSSWQGQLSVSKNTHESDQLVSSM
jgi:hypothetical protein